MLLKFEWKTNSMDDRLKDQTFRCFQAFVLFRHSFVKVVDPVDAADIDQTENTDDQGQSIQ